MQHKIVFLVISAEVVADDGVEFAFSDGNAASQKTQIYRSLYKLPHLPWDVLQADE